MIPAPFILKKLMIFVEYLCAFFFVIMCSSLSLQIFARYCFNVSFFWAEEVARYSMVWIVFLGAVAGVAHGAHTRIDFFIRLLPGAIQRYIPVLTNTICIVFLATLIYSSSKMINIGLIMKSTALKIPMVLVYGALPACSILMIIYLVWYTASVFLNKPQQSDQKEGETS